jgi:EpsI family protein
LALAGIAVLLAGGLYAAVLDWSNALVLFSLTAAFSLFMAAGLAAFADVRIGLFPANWSVFAAVALWILSAPIPPGTYSRLTMALQLAVTENVIRALHLLGVPAFRAGNIIELARGAVGVEEACSGIRSLMSCLFAGLFFSATLVRRPAARIALLVLAPVLALAMNFLRSLFLTLLANSGVAIAGTWHDAAGIAALTATIALLAGAAMWLGRDAKIGRDASPTRPRTARRAVPTLPSLPMTPAARYAPAPQKILALAIVAAVGFTLLFVANTRPSAHAGAPTPNLWAALPDSAAGWTVTTTRDLYQFKDTLRTDLLAQRIYARPNGEEVILYLAYWRPDQAPVSLVASHTPDACWPGAGWIPRPLPEARTALAMGDRTLPPAEARLFTSQRTRQYVWFWHLYDGRPILYQDPYSFRRLLAIAWRYGFRRGGDQLFVRVSSNRPWDDVAAEPFLGSFFARLRPFGL